MLSSALVDICVCNIMVSQHSRNASTLPLTPIYLQDNKQSLVLLLEMRKITQYV